MSSQILRSLLASASVAVALLLAGCGTDEDDLAGVWEGRSLDTSYVFHLQPDGRGRVRVATGARTVDYDCNWSVSGGRLKLQRSAGSDAIFRIVNQSGDQLTLRVGGASGAVCRLQRVALR